MPAELRSAPGNMALSHETANTCEDSPHTSLRAARWSTAAGVLSAIGVCAACCLLPFVLIALGVTGAWVGTFNQLAPYKWYFVTTTAVLLGYGFYVAYRPRRVCGARPTCRKCAPNQAMRIALWLGLVLALGGLLFEQIEPLLS